MLTRKIWLSCLTLAFACLLFAADANKVTGSYMVDGKTTAFKYAYPVKYTYDGKSYKAVLFSAEPVSADDLKTEDVFSLFSRKAMDNKIHAVEVNFNPDKTIRGVFIYDKAFDGALQTGGFEKFTATRFDATGVAGKIAMDAPRDFFKQKYQYNADFAVNW